MYDQIQPVRGTKWGRRGAKKKKNALRHRYHGVGHLYYPTQLLSFGWLEETKKQHTHAHTNNPHWCYQGMTREWTNAKSSVFCKKLRIQWMIRRLERVGLFDFLTVEIHSMQKKGSRKGPRYSNGNGRVMSLVSLSCCLPSVSGTSNFISCRADGTMLWWYRWGQQGNFLVDGACRYLFDVENTKRKVWKFQCPHFTSAFSKEGGLMGQSIRYHHVMVKTKKKLPFHTSITVD